MDDKLVRLSDVRLIESKPDAYPEEWNDSYEKGFMDAINAVLETPAVDAVEVGRGRWLVTDAYPHNVYCSECYKTYVQDHWQIWQDKPGDGGIERNYCPHCGARMDGRREDGDA